VVDDRHLTGGILSIGLSLFFLWASRRARYPIKLAMRTPLTPAGQVQEGMAHVAGQAAGEASKTSHVLGLNCLVSYTKIEVYYKHAKNRKWQTEFEAQKTAPFFVEDASGRIYVDPATAEFELDPDVELTTRSWWWRPTEKQRAALTQLKWTREGIETRLKDMLYDQLLGKYGVGDLPGWMKAAAKAGHKKLSRALGDPVFHQQAMAEGYTEPSSGKEREELEARYKRAFETAQSVRKVKARMTEQNLLPGDPVYVLGPAFNAPPEGGWPHPIIIRKKHPSDTFLVGEGTPGEVHQRIGKKSRNQALIALAFFIAGIVLLYNYYSALHS
jgi:hypothetical protein